MNRKINKLIYGSVSIDGDMKTIRGLDEFHVVKFIQGGLDWDS